MARRQPPATDDGGESRTGPDRGFDLQARLHDREAVGLCWHLDPAGSVTARTRFTDDPRAGEPSYGDSGAVLAPNNYLGLAGVDRVQAAFEAAGRGLL